MRPRHSRAGAYGNDGARLVHALRDGTLDRLHMWIMEARPDPIAWFRELHAAASRTESFEPDRAALASADEAGRPSVRYVLVREVSDEGFVFYTNYESRKGAELDRGWGALAYHWSSTGVQVRVEGPVSRTSEATSDAYFAGRPRGSQLGAWASDQSRALGTASELERRFAEVRERFEGATVPRPPHWGGYALAPMRLELWFNRDSRLHVRFEYERTQPGGAFEVRRLAP